MPYLSRLLTVTVRGLPAATVSGPIGASVTATGASGKKTTASEAESIVKGSAGPSKIRVCVPAIVDDRTVEIMPVLSAVVFVIVELSPSNVPVVVVSVMVVDGTMLPKVSVTVITRVVVFPTIGEIGLATT